MTTLSKMLSLLTLLCPGLTQLWAQSPGVDTLRIEQCRTWAVAASPSQQKKALAASVEALWQTNVDRNNLPKIGFAAQASWQSDVFGLPFKFPGSEIPQVPKDQYKLSAEINQRIWDGRSDRIQREQRMLDRQTTQAQADLDAFQVREIVTELFCKALLLQENTEVLNSARTDLEARQKQAEGAVAEGVALRTSVDQIKIQILKTEQQTALAKGDKEIVLALLGEWIGKAVPADVVLAVPTETALDDAGEALRPEYELFKLQRQGIVLGQSALQLRKQPRVDAFLQTGLGRPNPFNFFETGFEPFLLVGLRAQWSPVDWGNRKREAQILEIQSKNIDIQRDLLDQRLKTAAMKDGGDIRKYLEQLKSDDEMIALQEDILRRMDAQVKNGVATMTDYLSQSNLLTQAKLSKKLHELQALQSREMIKSRMGW